jgi:hypothetical protein
MQRAIANPHADEIEPKVDGVRALLVFREDGVIEARNRRGLWRDGFRHEPFRRGIRALAERVPLLWQGSVLDGELTAGRFSATMAALHGSREHAPTCASSGSTCRSWPAWTSGTSHGRRAGSGSKLLAQAFDVPYELSPLVEPSQALALHTADGRLEGSS